MKLRKSGTTILTVLLVLVVFSVIAIWHDKGSLAVIETEQLADMTSIISLAPQLSEVFSQVDQKNMSAFYLVGVTAEQPWPTSLGRPSYLDPLASKIPFRQVGEVYGGDLHALRYRSVKDLIALLVRAEKDTPGYLSGLEVAGWVVIPTHPFDISMKLLMGALLIITAVILTSRVQG